MKKLMLFVGVLVSTVSFGAENPQLKKEITDKLILDLSEVKLDENLRDFVVVSFQISHGEIVITEITGTQKPLVQKVKAKLTQMTIEQDCDEDTLYRYKFTFEKR